MPGRWLAVLPMALLVAGCTGTDMVSSTSSEHSMTCPGWQVGLHKAIVSSGYYSGLSNPQDNPTNDTFPVEEGLSDSGHPLDIAWVHLEGTRDTGNGTVQQGVRTQDMTVTMSFYRADDHTPLLAYDAAKGPPGSGNPGSYHWMFGPSAGELQTKLLQVRLSQPPSWPTPTAFVVEYAYQTDLDHNANTESQASFQYTVQFEYRVC